MANSELIREMKKRDQLKYNRQFDEYKKQRNYVLTQVEKEKKEYFSQLVKDKSNVSSIWKAIHVLTHKNRSYDPSAVNVPPDSLNDHFLSLTSRLLQSVMETLILMDMSVLLPCLTSAGERRGPSRAFHIPLLNVHEVGRLITGLKSKKSMGPDDIPARLLKHALSYIVESLTYIYNLCIQKSVFPKMFKTAKVAPFPNNTDRSDPNNFRHISLLSVLSKSLEGHIHNHLSKFMENHSLFHHLQSGFRSQHSCHTALSALCDMWLSAIDRSEIVGVVFLDFKKSL